MSGSPTQGEKFPNQQFPSVINSLFFTATPYLEHGSPSKKGGKGGKEGKETEGRDTSLSSLRPLLPRHRRSPNWRGTGFSTAFASKPPLSATDPGWERESGGATQAHSG